MPAVTTLTLEGVAYRHDDRSGTLFSDLDLTLAPGDRLAVIGANGVGKSTLLDLVCGRLTPVRGARHLQPGATVASNAHDGDPTSSTLDHVTAGDPRLAEALRVLRVLERACAADPADVGAALHLVTALDTWAVLDGWTSEAEAAALLDRLGVGPVLHQHPVGQLSGGERVRADLARALASRADLLVLDEPTEHLDLAGCAQLERMLGGFDGALLLASHDRQLLEALATGVVRLDRGAATVERGSLVDVEARRSADADRERREWEHDQRRRAATLQAADRRDTLANGMLVDPNTGRATQHFHFRKRAAKVERTAKVIRRRLQLDPAPPKPFVVPKPPPITMREVERGPGIVVRLRSASFTWPDSARPVFAGIDLELERGAHVALVGPNGSGKSTLLAAICGELQATSGTIELGAGLRIAQVRQQVDDLDDDLDVGYACAADPDDPASRRLALEMLASLQVRERTLGMKVGELSDGTRRKVAVARALLADSQLLVLDEPTNHLDLVARDVLATALASHPAAVLLATHDRSLLDRVAPRLLQFPLQR